MTTHKASSAEALVADIGFNLPGERLCRDVERAVRAALKACAVFPTGGDVMAIPSGPRLMALSEVLAPYDFENTRR